GWRRSVHEDAGIGPRAGRSVRGPGGGVGRPARAAVTDMSQPLGTAIGNALDVAEAVRVLRGEERGLLRNLSVAFAGVALAGADGSDEQAGRARAERVLDSGEAAEVFGRMVEAQGG